MDKEIPKEEIKKRKITNALKYAASFVAVSALIWLTVELVADSGVKREQLVFSVAETGDVENSVAASGKVVPAFEEVVVSPVATRIMEIYRHEGEEVEAGEPLMRLDLQATEVEVRKLSDELSMKRYDTEQTTLNSRTYLTNLEMQIEAKTLAVGELKAEVANERRLDSIGSGTGDRVRQTELAYKTAIIELEQLKKQLANERASHSASHQSKKLEEGIYRKNLEEAKRKLADAGVKAPRKATLTYINSNIGSSIAAGEKLAVLSDLGHFRVNAELPEGDADKISAGSRVTLKLGKTRLGGKVSHVVPQAVNGMMSFFVMLDDDSDKRLRSGIRIDMNVVCGLKEDVVRIANGAYFRGAGEYVMFVDKGDDRLEARKVTLGDSNFDYVEVVSGLQPGEKVVITDMEEFKDKSELKLK